MPFVEGESLRHRLGREHQLPVDDAVRIAVTIANALDYAHSHGVIHRDLKPENILLQHGQPVIADFGTALAISNAGGGRITQTGLSLGTPQYMSPEQATSDRVIDGRTDICSLGAVLYEMLTGEPPHAAATAQAIIAKRMTEEVRPLTVLRKSVPPYLDAAVRRALEKLPADRYATAAQFADALLTPRVVVPETGAQPVAAPAPTRTRAQMVFVALPWAVAALGVAYGVRSAMTRSAPTPLVPVHFTLPIKAPLSFDPARSTIAVSPDGSHIAFTAASGGNSMQAFIRSVTDDEAHAVPGTESSNSLFFSPDGAWLGFRGIDAQIKRVPIGGGAPSADGRRRADQRRRQLERRA